VIGITGSNGKTTSKELIFSVLSTETKAYATRGNLNNHIGVPLTLLGMPADTEIAIIEMGANQPGDIAELVSIAEPTHGLITNVGYAHIEKLGGLDGVRVTKGALFDFVGTHGTGIFVNAADPNVVLAAAPYPHQITFGTPEADWRCEVIHNSLEGMTLDIYHRNWEGPERFESQLSGIYNSHNILAAVAIGHTFGISVAGLKAGIYQYVPANNRSQVIRRGTRTIWMDAYNANPSSMQASIRNVFEMNPGSRTVLILGDMLEMGIQAEQVHRELGLFINQFSPLLTIGVGPLMQHMTSALKGPARWYPDASTLRSEIAVLLSDADMILIKGSRGMALERVLDQI
jgi:UDP-N-acetylmuramoyl-tripeptide--D-alanyl-D-alanine ligase